MGYFGECSYAKLDNGAVEEKLWKGLFWNPLRAWALILMSSCLQSVWTQYNKRSETTRQLQMHLDEANQRGTSVCSVRFDSKQEIKSNLSPHRGTLRNPVCFCHLWCDSLYEPDSCTVCRMTALVLLVFFRKGILLCVSSFTQRDDLRLIWPRGEDTLPDILPRIPSHSCTQAPD